MELTVYTFDAWHDELEKFTNYYTIEYIVGCPDKKIRDLQPKNKRTCRFCGLGSPKTKFKKEAHIIPHLLGNRYLVSDYECDTCNSLFSAYENDLANFLGISRTVLGVKAKESIPSFVSNDKAITAKHGEFNGLKDCVKIERATTENNAFNIDNKLGHTQIKYLKNPYTPVKVYKAFLKIALSAMPNELILNYRDAIEILFSDSYDESLLDFFKVVHYQLPSNYCDSKPSCILFKKLNYDERIITHIFYLRFQNNVYEFPVMLHQEDIKIGLFKGGEKITVPMCPPILFSRPETDSFCGATLRDLSSNLKVKEEDVLTFSMPPNALSNTHSTNPYTGETTNDKFDPNDIVAMYIAPSSSKIDLSGNIEKK